MTVVAGEYAEAGWYDDGVTAGVLRWFDGTTWTEATRTTAAQPARGAQSAPVAAPMTVSQPTGDAALGQQRSMVWSGLPFTSTDDRQVITRLGRRAAWEFWIGLGLLVVGPVIAALSSSGGSGGQQYVVPTAGVVGGLGSFALSRRHYWAMVGLGGDPWRSSSLTFAVVCGSIAVLLAVVASVDAFTASSAAALGSAGAGACWPDTARTTTGVWGAPSGMVTG